MATLTTKHPHDVYIDQLGGTTKAAVFFDVSPASVSEWRRTGIPRARMMYLRAVRPDLFNAGRKTRKTNRTP